MRSDQMAGSPGSGSFAGRRKAVRLNGRDLVKVEPAAEGGIPCVIQPAIEAVDPVGWACEQSNWIAELLLQHRALLFRGFALDAAGFAALVRGTSGELLEYRDRSTPREDRGKGVYTSTIYPAREEIRVHNEGTYWSTWPLRIQFYCQKPADTGGETPIADVRRVSDAIDSGVRQRFLERRVMYVRNYNGGLGLPWQEVFQTHDRLEVESYCGSHQIEWEWLSGDRLRTRQTRPAFRQHPHTGEQLWFNHAAFFNLAARDVVTRETIRGSFGEAELPFQTYYGDGTPIATSDVEHILAAYARCRVVFPWRQGDLLVLDNMTIAHGRNPFTGNRDVLTAMTQPVAAAAT